jgi:hypothetical protein
LNVESRGAREEDFLEGAIILGDVEKPPFSRAAIHNMEDNSADRRSPSSWHAAEAATVVPHRAGRTVVPSAMGSPPVGIAADEVVLPFTSSRQFCFLAKWFVVSSNDGDRFNALVSSHTAP